MSKIEISVAVDATKPEELKALSNYLLALANLSGVKTPETNTTATITASEVKEAEAEAEPAPAPAAGRKRQASKAKTEAPKEEQETPAAEAAKEEAPEEEVKEAAPAKEETTIKIDTLRTLLSKKVDANRDAIKDKLTELGTKNLTTLDPKDYQTMYDFFISLKDSE